MVEAEIKLIIFYDDDEVKKEKYVIIEERNSFGIKVKLCNRETMLPYDDAVSFEIPNHRILKIKDIKEADDDR